MFKFVLLISTLLVISVQGTTDIKEVGCYYGSWVPYRSGLGNYNISKIDPLSCTTLYYAFETLTQSGEVKIIDPWMDLEDDGGKGSIRKFNALKEQNPALKTLASFGGWNVGSTNFSIVAADADLRKTFAQSCLDFIQKYNFSGVDLDWEYPMRRNDLNNDDRNNYNLMLKEIKELFEPYGYLVTVTVSSTKDVVEAIYNVPEMVPYVDFINIMAYDLHVGSENKTGFNAALYPAEGETDVAEKQLNVDAILQYWTSVAPANKLVLGTPFYGHTFTLANASDTLPRSASSGPGPAGPYTQEPGTISYNELCIQWQTEQWNQVFDNNQKVPYAYLNGVWVSYENSESIRLKGELALKYGLAGVMTWSLENDDFNGLCGEGNSPLLNALYESVNPTVSTEEKENKESCVFESIRKYFIKMNERLSGWFHEK